jgi:hypothetical protein
MYTYRHGIDLLPSILAVSDVAAKNAGIVA